MNDRIKELAEQAGFGTEWFEEAPLGYPASPREGIIKNFTELIVRECAEVSKNYADGSMPLSIALAIKKHFGIES